MYIWDSVGVKGDFVPEAKYVKGWITRIIDEDMFGIIMKFSYYQFWNYIKQYYEICEIHPDVNEITWENDEDD